MYDIFIPTSLQGIIAIQRFLNLPLWANFYNYTDLSGTTSTIPLDQLTNWMTSTSTLNQASPAAQVEAG